MANLDRGSFNREVGTQVGLDGIQEGRRERKRGGGGGGEGQGRSEYRDVKSSAVKGNIIKLTAEKRLGSRKSLWVGLGWV